MPVYDCILLLLFEAMLLINIHVYVYVLYINNIISYADTSHRSSAVTALQTD